MSDSIDLMALNVEDMHEKLVIGSGYGYVLVSGDLRLIYSSPFAKKLFPELYSINKGDSIKDCIPIMEEIQIQRLHGNTTHRLNVRDYLLKCDVTGRFYEEQEYYFIEWRDETTVYELLDMDTKYIGKLQEEVKKTIEEVTRVQNSIVLGMATMVESRDNSTGGHVL